MDNFVIIMDTIIFSNNERILSTDFFFGCTLERESLKFDNAIVAIIW